MFICRVMVKYVVRTGKREVFGLVGGALRADVVIAQYHNAVRFYGSRHPRYNGIAVYLFIFGFIFPWISGLKGKNY